MGTIPDELGPAPESRRDADLAVAAASGDSEALAAIYDRYASRVFALAARQLRDRDAAADVTQEVFLTTAQRIGGLTDPERLRSWIFAVARHQIVDHVRRSRRVVPTDTIEDVETMQMRSDESEGFDRVRGAELRVLLADSSAGLDDRDRMVLELAYGAELAGADLADALGVKENTAHQLLSRARTRLRTSLGALLVARQGRHDCDELATLLEPWDGTFSTVWRKRVARHVDGCEVCSDTERRVLAPAALGTAFPALLVPDGVREEVLAGLDLVSAPAAAATGSDGSRRDDTAWQDDGFPPADRDDLAVLATVATAGTPRRSVGVLLAVAGVVLLAVLGAWWGASALTDDSLLAGGTPTVDPIEDAAAPPTAPSTQPTGGPAPASSGEASTDASVETSDPVEDVAVADPVTTDEATDEPATAEEPLPPDPAPFLNVNPAGSVRLSRSGVVEFIVSHTGDTAAAVTVSVPAGFAADPALVDVGAGEFAQVTVRWGGTPSDPPPPGTIVLEAPGFESASVQVEPFQVSTTPPPLPPPPPPPTTRPGTLVPPTQGPPVLVPPG